MRTSASGFSRSTTSTKNWSTVSIVSVAARTLISTGSCMNVSASRRISGGTVALKRAVWRPIGQRRRIVSTSSRKPRSSISSASSRITYRAWSRNRWWRLIMSSTRPDGAHHDLGPGLEAGGLLADRAPPKIAVTSNP